MRFQIKRGVVATTLVAIAIVGCGGGPETASETPTSETETAAPVTAAEGSSDAPTEGVLAECEAVQDVLDGDFNNGFGASLSGDSGEIDADDDKIAAVVSAATATDGMEEAQEEAQEILDGLTAVTVNDTELAGYKDAYLAKLNEILPELEAAAAYYASLEEAIDADALSDEQAALLETAPTQTKELADTFDSFNDDFEDIDEDIFDYCLDAELDAEFPDN